MSLWREARVPAVVACFGAASLLPLYALPLDVASPLASLGHSLALVVAAVLMLRAAAAGEATMRRSRQLFAAALTASATGGAIGAAYAVQTERVPIPSLIDPVTLMWIPLAVVGFWLIPRQAGTRVRVSRLMADGAVSGCALLFASWIAVIEPLLDSGRWSALALATQVAYPVADVVVVTMVLSLLPRVRADLRRMLNVVGAGLLLVAVSDSGFMAALAHHGEPAFGWPSLTLQAGLFLLTYAAVTRSRPVLRDRETSPAIDRHLAYLPAVLALGIGAYHLRDGAVDAQDAVLGAMLLFVVLARQALLSRDMAALSDRHLYAAGHDELTGLANRLLFFRNLEEHLATPGTGTAAVLLVDLDGFKEVNDTLGHQAGDRVLVQFSQFLTAVAPGVLLARLGGDEFAALLRCADAEQTAAELGALVAAGSGAPECRLLAALTCSVGLTTTRDGDGGADVLRRADLAMYDAKRASGSRVSVFTEALAQQSERRHLLAADLAFAVEREELRLVYQPLYRLGDGTLAGAEALLRWTHPLFGNVPPDEFIPLAEETGHIHAIGSWVLGRAVQQTAAWEHAGRHLPRLFVNVSAAQFTAGLPATVASVLSHNQIEPDRLTLEITESQMPGLSVNEAMRQLRTAGVQIALDDFGAGYSSLAQLARLPVDVLKIDRDFVRNLGESAGRPVLDAVINLAKSLGLSTVAEGIEDIDQAAEASNAGADLGQGYLFSRPVDPDQLQRRLPAAPIHVPVQPNAASKRSLEAAADARAAGGSSTREAHRPPAPLRRPGG